MRETAEQLADYAAFLADVDAPWCWACGRNQWDRPEYWAAPWAICRAHIVSSPRICDVRAVVLLCSRCHERSHGARFPDEPTPEILRSHLLWWKRERDPTRFDPAFLARYAIGRIPDPTPPENWYRTEYCRRRGGAVTIDAPGRVTPR